MASFIDGLGFDVADAGRLAEGWRFQRDTRGYVVDLNAGRLTEALAAAKRYREM